MAEAVGMRNKSEFARIKLFGNLAKEIGRGKEKGS